MRRTSTTVISKEGTFNLRHTHKLCEPSDTCNSRNYPQLAQRIRRNLSTRQPFHKWWEQNVTPLG